MHELKNRDCKYGVRKKKHKFENDINYGGFSSLLESQVIVLLNCMSKFNGLDSGLGFVFLENQNKVWSEVIE